METPKIFPNKFCDQAKSIARHIVQDLYRQELSVAEFFERYASRDFSWISTSEAEFFCTFTEAREHFLSQIQEMPKLHVYDDDYECYQLTAEVCLVLAHFWLETNEEDGAFLREHQRASLLFRWEGNPKRDIKIVHMHFSNPWWPMRDSKKWPVELGRFSYEYLMEKIVERKNFHPELTLQQRKILYMLSQGMTYREISDIVGVTQRTVRYHVENLMDKFDVQTKSQLIAMAEQCDTKYVIDYKEDDDKPPPDKENRPNKRKMRRR